MRVLPGVEEDHVSRVRPDDRAIPLHRGDVRRFRVVSEDQFARTRVIRAEKHGGQRIRVDVTLEPHRRPALHVEDNAIAVVHGRGDRLRAGFARHLEELPAVGPVEPWQALAHLLGVYATTGDALNFWCLARQDRRSGEVVEVGVSGHRADLALPACGKNPVEVERGPAESRRHAIDYELHELYSHRRIKGMLTVSGGLWARFRATEAVGAALGQRRRRRRPQLPRLTGAYRNH